jgi:hypothetical protein
MPPTVSELRKNRRRRRLDRMNDLQSSSKPVTAKLDFHNKEGTAISQSPLNITHVSSHQSKLNIKSRESSLLANIKKLDEEYREMKKPFVNPREKDDIVFYSGVGYKKVPVRQSFDDITRKHDVSAASPVKDSNRSAVTSNTRQKSPPKYKNLVQMMEPDDVNHLMTYSPTNQLSKSRQ